MRGARIVLGVSGSIAAYKAVDLAGRLAQRGGLVDVVLTRDAQRFVTPLPFRTLTRRPVVAELFGEEEGWKPSHIRLADEADLLLLAPATAHLLARLAHGLADDALGCIALALDPRVPVLAAPAMNGRMWLHPATRANAELLASRGVEFLGPQEGMLACGYEGVGRLWDLEGIVERAESILSSREPGE